MPASRARSAPSSRWRAAASPGGLIGILLFILCLLLAGGTLLVLTGRADLPIFRPLVWVGLVLFILALFAVAFLLYGYVTMSYEFNDRELIIRWAGTRYVVDLEQIQHIGPAAERLSDNPGHWRRFWTGYYVGRRAGRGGPIMVVATLPLRRQLLVVAGDRQFAISPERPVLFVEEYGRRRRALDLQRTGGFPTIQPGESAQRLADAGWTTQFPTMRPSQSPPVPASTQSMSAATRSPMTDAPEAEFAPEPGRSVSPLLRPLLLNDPTALGLLALAVVLNVLMVTYVLVQYESLPPSIVLHWNANGDPDRIGSPREIWTLPIITGLVTIANFGLAWSIVTFDRFAARFLLGATCIVQFVAWVALLTLTR